MNKFSRLFEDRQLGNQPKEDAAVEAAPAEKTVAAIAPPVEADNAKQAPAPARKRKKSATAPVKLKPPTKQEKKAKKAAAKANSKKPRKRGRPANGKRSDPNWFGRTFYIRKQTDDLLESALFKLKREGIELDKSQLVDALLNAWSQVELEQAKDFCIGEILEKPNPDSEED